MEVVPLRNSPPILPDRHRTHSSIFSIPSKPAFSIRGGRTHFLARTRAVREKQRDDVLRRRWIAEEEDEIDGLEASLESLEGEGDEGEESALEASFLSLSVKPDRNMALLDDYEMEELSFDSQPNHRSGYIAVVGKPNVGKSTLSNQMVGQKLSIVTDKPQTTRHRILGICSGTDYQMILYDTPGVIEKKMHKLDTMMMKNVRSAAVNADCALIVVDASKMPDKMEEVLEEGFGGLKDRLPTLLVLNKKDLIKPGEIAKKIEWYEKFTDVDEVIPVSAKYGQGVEDVKEWILSKLPFGPPLYPKDIASEHPERFFVGEIVREKIFMQYRNEVPYACQVNVVSYKTRPDAKEFIQVEILVERTSQKSILIGKEGRALKVLATAARLDIEDFLQKKVFLEVEVKVKENWRQDEGLLKHYGYGDMSHSTNSSKMSNNCHQLPCLCGYVAIESTAKTEANYGRRFWGCPLYVSKQGCGFFKWKDDEFPTRASNVIRKLVKDKKKLEEETMELKDLVRSYELKKSTVKDIVEETLEHKLSKWKKTFIVVVCGIFIVVLGVLVV